MKILTVIGARPQFIKAAVISRAFAEHRADVREIIAHTGQHYDANMSDVFFEELNIPHPHHNLGVGGGSHGQNTGRMLEKLESLMEKEAPDWVLVYGDTDSTLAGALAAVKLHIPVAHVEAGLRSFNRRMPEEINRVLTDHVSSMLFVPTETARINIQREGIASEKVRVTGDVMYDASLFYKKNARKPKWFDALNIAIDEFVLCTVHRAENTDEQSRIERILKGLSDGGRPVIFPLHPRTRMKLKQMNISLPKNVFAVDPVGYLEMIWLEINCKLVATDSGGVQKEAYFHKKHCVTLREETEWVELVSAKLNILAGTDSEKIATSIRRSSVDFNAGHGLLYGDGSSGRAIVEAISI